MALKNFDWLEKDQAKLAAKLARWQGRKIREKSGAKWQSTTDGSFVADPPPAAVCIWEWNGTDWNGTDTCTSGHCRKPGNDGTPMPVGMQVTTECE